MKRTVITSLLLASAMAVTAGPVSSSIGDIMAIPGIMTMDMPKDQFGKSADFVKEAKIVMLDESNQPQVDKIFASLPEDLIWIQIESEGATVLMYGEKSDGSDSYVGLMKINSPEQNMVITVEGSPEAFKDIIN